MEYEVEQIPDEDFLYRRINREMIDNNSVKPAAFKQRLQDKGCLSVDWAKYSRPDETIKRTSVAAFNGCVSLKSGNVRYYHLAVEHRPSYSDNRAHSVVHSVIYKAEQERFEDLTFAQRVRLSRIAVIEVKPRDYLMSLN